MKFRVIAINHLTRPYNVSNGKLRILDPHNNQLKAWKNIGFNGGIFEGSFEYNDLSEGVYEVLAEVDGTVSTSWCC